VVACEVAALPAAAWGDEEVVLLVKPVYFGKADWQMETGDCGLLPLDKFPG